MTVRASYVKSLFANLQPFAMILTRTNHRFMNACAALSE
jgi:hypothetical protein